MRLHEDEIEEWHRLIYKQRQRYRWFLESILNGVPKIRGMASEYRDLTLKEIKRQVKELLSDD